MKYLVGNWKIYINSLSEAKDLVNKCNENKLDQKEGVETILCVPSIWLKSLDWPSLGAQNVFWKDKGAYTGETSPSMVSELGVEYCLVGHSERRKRGVTDEQINKKIKLLLKKDITPILLVGSKEKEDDKAWRKIEDQISIALDGVDLPNNDLILGYEPVWAISQGGKGEAASPKHVSSITSRIKDKCNTSVLYGGSTDSDNIKRFLELGSVDGVVPGSASTDFNELSEMVEILKDY